MLAQAKKTEFAREGREVPQRQRVEGQPTNQSKAGNEHQGSLQEGNRVQERTSITVDAEHEKVDGEHAGKQAKREKVWTSRSYNP